VRDYVATFTGKSITTDQWKTHLFEYFRGHGGEEKIKVLNSVDWNVRNCILPGSILSGLRVSVFL